jgi:UDP-glucose 4-epimerase
LYWTLHGLDYRILRVANAYGERQPITETQGVISAFLHKAMRREEIVIWGDGSAVRDYVYVSDIVDAFVKAAEYAGEFKVFNIGSGVGHSLNEILDIMKVIHRKPSRVVYKPGRACDVPANVLDIRRAEKHLNWRPAVNLFEGMRQTIEWMSNRIIDLRPILNRPAKCA